MNNFFNRKLDVVVKLAFAFTLILTLVSAPAMASDRVLIEPAVPGVQPEPPSIGDLVDLGVGPSFDVMFNTTPTPTFYMGPTVLGTIGLMDFAPGITLAATLGGALLAPLGGTGGPVGAAKAGLTVQFPATKKNIRAAIGGGITYTGDDKLGVWGALVFHVF